MAHHNAKWHQSEANREKHRKLAREWQKANRERHADAERQRRARKLGGETDGHTRGEVFARDGGVCQICGATLDPKDWHEDHIIPLVRGGHDVLGNVQATCPPCNRRKHANVA